MGLSVPCPQQKGRRWPSNRRETREVTETLVSAVRCLTTGDSAESKHRLWLFTPAHRRPRTGFGISLRAEALHPLQVARTSEEVQKTAYGGATSKGDQSTFENSPALRGRRKD